ncbi:hypothetical protein [Mucilaginibacter ginkgonis]|uniref:Uncharacterized protein n=1 Tax=Mucilaginibacter ginkgonis TaxID=2682091 RepID=A0A6I4HWX5_9SPHI|nr:hypothetical protein [Mucilaginibacter ginkgonis]QQL49885.1 hypothetical protein GO620_000090 [Mucilaginibacter ginkgonis]
MKDYKKKLGSLADRIKNETLQAPIQQVQPVVNNPTVFEQELARFNNWIPKDLKRKIQLYGVKNDMSQKDITIKALEDFLNMNNR